MRFHEFQQTCSKRKCWSYNKGDYVKLNRLITEQNWDFIDNIDINSSCLRFTETLLSLMTLCIPSKLVTIRPNDKPWYDSQVRTFSRQRDRQKKIATKSTKQNDWVNYKHLRNKVNNLKKHAKERCFSNLEQNIANCRSDNPNQYWKML